MLTYAQVLASLAKHGPSLNHALYAAEPLALHLRVSLTLLLDLCPPTHPDAQHLRSAMQVPSLLAFQYKSTKVQILTLAEELASTCGLRCRCLVYLLY
jgi:hypothetical protein